MDGSDSIDVWEMGLLLGELGMLRTNAADAQATVAQIHRAMDADGSGAVEWCELLEWWRSGGAAAVAEAEARHSPLVARASRQPKPATAPVSATNRPNPPASSLAGALSAEATQSLRSLFNRHDRDFSGTIDLSELTPLLIELGVISSDGGAPTEMDELLAEVEMAHIDTDGDGTISFAELCAWWHATGRGAPPPSPHVHAAHVVARRLENQRSSRSSF